MENNPSLALSERAAEIIISSVKPFHLMTGKIIGVSLAALTQVLIWGAMFFVFSYIFSIVFGISTSYNRHFKIKIVPAVYFMAFNKI